jgi:Spy/CpxP family protein refolding chaperone
MKKTSILTILVFLLLAINAITIFQLFKKNQGRPRSFNPSQVFEKLQLDSIQKKQFESLRIEFFQKRDSLRSEEISIRKEMANMISTGVVDSLKIDSITQQLAAKRKEHEVYFYHHFLHLRSLLKPEQQQHFDEVLEMILKRQSSSNIKNPGSSFQKK